MRVALLALLLGAALVSADGTCSAKAGGLNFDLSALANPPKGYWMVDYTSGTDTWTFLFNICGELSSSITDTYTDCVTHFPAQAVQIDTYDNCKRIADGNPTASYDATKKALNLTYGNGDYCIGAQHNRALHVILTCSDTAGSPSIIEDPPKSCFYTVNWNHPAACPVGGGGLGFGCILVLAVCLFVGGFFWQKFKVHATGLDLIIFWSFWRSLPGLVWDGMKFVFHLCTFCCRKQGYSQSVSFLNITITE